MLIKWTKLEYGKNTYSIEYVTDPLSENAFVNKISDLTKISGPTWRGLTHENRNYVTRFTFCSSILSVSEDNWSICSALPIKNQDTTASTFIVVTKTLRWIGSAAENQLKINTWDWQSPTLSLAKTRFK